MVIVKIYWEFKRKEMEKKVLSQLEKMKGLMVYEMGIPINEQKTYPKKQLLNEQLLKFFFKELLGSGDDVVGSFVKLNDGSVMKITDYNPTTLTIQGPRFDGDSYNFWRNTKGLSGEDLGTKMKVLDGGEDAIKTLNDFINPRIYDNIKSNIDGLISGDEIATYLKGSSSTKGTFLNDLESLYIDMASKMTKITRAEVKKLIQKMDDSGHLDAITDVLTVISKSEDKITLANLQKELRAALKKQDNNLVNASQQELDEIIKFNIRQIEELSPTLSKKIKSYFKGKAPIEKLFSAADEIFDPKIIKTLDDTTDLFTDLTTFKNFLSGGGPGATKFLNAFKHVERGGIDKIVRMVNNDIIKTIRQFPVPFSVMNTVFGQYLKRLDYKWLWQKGYKTLNDLDDLPGTKAYLKAKYGDDVLEETVAGSDNLKILDPAYNDFRAERLVDGWNERSGWKSAFKIKNGSQENYIFGLWKQGVKKQFRNDVKRLGISAEMLQSWRGLANLLFIAGLVLEPGWTLTMFYEWLDTVIPFTDAIEKGKEQLATAAALQSKKCRKSGLQHWIDFNSDNDEPNLHTYDQLFEDKFKEYREDAQSWLFSDGWKSIAPCITKYRKEMSKLDKLDTHDLMGVIMQVSTLMKVLSQAGKITSGGFIDPSAYVEQEPIPSPDDILDRWNTEIMKEKTQ